MTTPSASGATGNAELASFAALAGAYKARAGHFDELLDADGTLYPEWQAFAAAGDDLGVESFAHAAAYIARQIHENGVTYNVYAADGPGRPWTLDVLPVIVRAHEWDAIELGLRQRARLLNAVAADLYGARRLIGDGIVPPSVVFRHPGFLRPCCDVQPAGDVFLTLVAFDLVRGPDGAWRVIDTRAQAPSGLGYTLENRATAARLFPGAARALNVRPLGPFRDALQEALLSNAPNDGETPLAVLLTPGPFSETYFEHAFLARQLGVPLVHGGDLAVRQDRVFVKTVSGLRRVHSIWRRLDDDYCDPVELRADSTLGVPGLVHAWRSGHIQIANAFGLGVLESSGLGAFLEQACGYLFGEPLALPSVATIWCGEPNTRSSMLDRFEQVVIKSAIGAPVPPTVVADLGSDARAAWQERLRGDPDAFIVEEALPASQAPVWQNGELVSGAMALRVFLLTDGHGDYTLMPGGLARIAGHDQPTFSGQRGGTSKDAWVLSATPVDPSLTRDAPLRVPAPGLGERTTSSRSAEHLFWLGRYAERSENSARMLRAVLQRTADASAWRSPHRRVILRACHEAELLPASDETPWPLERALIDGIFDREHHRSLGFNLDHTCRAAGSVRERLSLDNWRVLSGLSERLEAPPPAGVDLSDTLTLLDDTIVALVAVGGLEMAHMTRDDGWRFLSLGRHLERLAFVGTTLDAVVAEGMTGEAALLEWLLDLSDSSITYRARYLRRPEWSTVFELLCVDQLNPRSALFQVAKLEKHVRLLPDAGMDGLLQDMERLQRAAPSNRDQAQGQLFDAAHTLEELPRACAALAGSLSEALTFRYFTHAHERPQATVAT